MAPTGIGKRFGAGDCRLRLRAVPTLFAPFRMLTAQAAHDLPPNYNSIPVRRNSSLYKLKSKPLGHRVPANSPNSQIGRQSSSGKFGEISKRRGKIGALRAAVVRLSHPNYGDTLRRRACRIVRPIVPSAGIIHVDAVFDDAGPDMHTQGRIWLE